MKEKRTVQMQEAEELIQVLRELREISSTHAIVVEGMKDVESLRNLGITENVVQLNIGKPLLEFCSTTFEGMEGVVILTDWETQAVWIRGGYFAPGSDTGTSKPNPNLGLRASLPKLVQ